MPNETPSQDGFQDAMNTMLPPQNGVSPHITVNSQGSPNAFGQPRSNGPHDGVDFNYVGGQQSPLNQNHPSVHSPVDGTVEFSGGQYGTVKIKDAEGNSHEVLHLHNRSVASGQQINAGDQIGTMGGRGPSGPNEYSQHIHYRMRDSNGEVMDPQQYWKDRAQSQESQTDTQPQVQPQSSAPAAPSNESQAGIRVSDNANAEWRHQADAFRHLPPEKAVEQHPELASAYGSMRAIESRVEADGLTEQQQKTVMNRVHQNIAGQIERGNIPDVQIREETQIQAVQQAELSR